MKRQNLVVTWAVVTVSVGGLASGFVGVNDPCPWPTPSPPDGAGWAVVYNPGFEGGFSNGVANQWTGWKDSGLPGTVHYAATDRRTEGSYAQKLAMPDPIGDMQEAGIYQRMYVVPGEIYTATVRMYLEINNPDQWQLLAHLGLDPYGEDTGDSSSTVWNETATYGSWLTKTVTVQAVLPVMTISLKASRKWPISRTAIVWFDQVTFSGPIPTEPPPGPGEEPIDPETLIPPTMGSNLVGNASFEDTYAAGVSSGWNRWWTTGTGEWKRSQRVGKVGGAKYDCGGDQENVDMRPKTTMLISGNPEDNPSNPPPGTLGSSDLYKTFDHMQDTIIIGRPMVDNNYGNYYSNPTYWGTRLANHCKTYERMFPRIDAWLDWNEPDTSYNWQAVIDFSMAFNQRCHELGLKTVVLNLATGNPGNIWQMVNETYDPHCGDLLTIADYLGHHVYGWAPDEFMVSHQVMVDACSFALRPRRFKDMYDRRGWRLPPVIATEGSTSCYWHGKYTPDQIYTDLVTMGDYMNADRWWCGYTNFVVGAMCSWPDFDLVGQYLAGGQAMTAAIGNWNHDHPADSMEGYYSQMFGAGNVHPKTLAELTPAGLFNGGVNQLVSGLTPGREHLLICWMKYEFRGHQPDQLEFYFGVDPTGQTSDGAAGTINWGTDQIAEKAPVHEVFSHVWRTFTATTSSASIWLRARHPVADPSFKVYVDLVEVRQLDDTPPEPFIAVTPATLNVNTTIGRDPPNDSFDVRNSGEGTITYGIASDCAWLTVVPDNGTSTGETDTIELAYDVANLTAGQYQCSCTITAPEATNSPTSAPIVVLTITSVKPDFDGDGDVDQQDFGRFQTCFSGPGIVQEAPPCLGARLDEDEDVDQDDFAIFQDCMSGANITADPDCASQYQVAFIGKYPCD